MTITGNLTKDAEVAQLGGTASVLNLSVAVNDRKKNAQTGEWEDDPQFFDVRFYDATGNRVRWMQAHLVKGFKVTVQGKLHQDKWVDKATQQNRSKVVINAFDIEATWPKAQAVAQPMAQPMQQPMAQPMYQSTQQPVQQPMAQPVQQPMAQPVQQTITRPAIYDSDIPF